ncbi:MAG: efflux RND transporter periplasmic adaptor subunit [Byssovorax sp.]
MKVLRRPWLWVLAALLIAALGLWARQRVLGPTVVVAPAARRAIVQKIVASGRVLPPARVNVGTLVSGVIAAVEAREGARVKAGDVLARVDDAELRVALSQAEAGLQLARARLAQARTVGAQVASFAHQQADANFALAERSYQRAVALAESGGLSQAELDEARRARDIAKSQQESTEAQSKAAGPGGADHLVAQAGVAQALANVAAAEVRLAEATIKAPADGVLLQRAIEPGDLVQAGRTLFVLARDGETLLMVEPDEKNLPHLSLGQKARASADAFPGAPFDAIVSYVAPAVDPQRGTIEVRLAVPSPPPFLRPDMTVSVDAEAGRRPDALVLSAEALHDAGTAHPFVLVLAAGKVERRPIELGLRGDGIVEILAGVGEGDLCLLGATDLAPGARARPLVKGE